MRSCLLLALLPVAAASIASAQWQAAPSFSSPRQHAFGVSRAGTLYALGGEPWVGGDRDGSVHTLAPGAQQWFATAPMLGMGPFIHQGGGIDSLGRIIVFGGYNADDPGGSPPDPFIYDTVEGDGGPVAPRGAAAPDYFFAWCTDDEGRIYSLGGGRGANAGANGNKPYGERYLAASDTWQPIAPMPAGVADAAAEHDGAGHILVIGGWNADGSARTANVARYDIASDTWSDTAVPDLPVALSGARAIRGSDRWIYLLGGETGPANAPTLLGTCLIYRSDLNTWSNGPALPVARKWIAAARGNDEHVYALGGTGASGGTMICEKLYTPTCPTFTIQPQSREAWTGQTLAICASASGGAPLSYLWHRDGVALSDGPTGHGSAIEGATTDALLIVSPSELDAGSYQLIASNPCGDTASDTADVSFRSPIAIPPSWIVTNLHPTWAEHSYAYSIDDGVQVGSAYWVTPPYDQLEHPIRWNGDAASALDLTPPGSVGGAARAAAGTAIAGWWWWPYQCYIGGQWYTCYSMQACQWNGGVHDNLQVGGWEYGEISGSDGGTHVGHVWEDFDDGGRVHAGMWVGPAWGFRDLHPAGAVTSWATAVDSARQYGGVYTYRSEAAAWSSSAASFVSLHPPSATGSSISGARDGQQIGSATIAGAGHAGLWAEAALTFMDLHPAGHGSSALFGCRAGLQVGQIDGRAAIWAGAPASYVDLHEVLPPEFSGSNAEDLWIAPDGTVEVVGHGYNGATGRTEALLWRSGSPCAADMDGNGALNVFDFLAFQTFFSNEDPRADLAPPIGVFNVFDFLAFQTAFGVGC